MRTVEIRFLSLFLLAFLLFFLFLNIHFISFSQRLAMADDDKCSLTCAHLWCMQSIFLISRSIFQFAQILWVDLERIVFILSQLAHTLTQCFHISYPYIVYWKFSSMIKTASLWFLPCIESFTPVKMCALFLLWISQIGDKSIFAPVSA